MTGPLKSAGEPAWLRAAAPRRAGPAELARRNGERGALLRECVRLGAKLSCGGAKVHTGKLSRGCRLCAGGHFSCAFLTERCTRSCFFCLQDRACSRRENYAVKEIMNGFSFTSAAGYARYAARLGWRGAGFSGGEPFLEFGRLLDCVRRLRALPGRRLYLWAYSNGDLVTEERLRALAAAGLDELRLDLSARNYDLAPLRLAAGLVKTVAVEIPAIPEDLRRVTALLPALAAAGAKYLNLHQLQFTPHNARAFAARGYTPVQAAGAEAPPALESELAALKLVRAALRSGAGLPVHYCSKVYKDRYLALAGSARLAAAGRRAATATGLLRSPASPGAAAARGAVTVAYCRLGAAGRETLAEIELDAAGRALLARLERAGWRSAAGVPEAFRRKFEGLEYRGSGLPPY